ncbi:MAG: 2'-5' RNA ligase family protein [Robiginitalea sp.]|uniref:2'-5' RNA ligase family protein n=2 Tax=Robiginitalea sp. TaxID=1902411 RepID=UPI003C75A598
MEAEARKRHYFIALVPESPLRDTVDGFKREIKRRYGAAHALKSPAHITLQMPFHWLESKEPLLEKCLREFAAHQTRVMVNLNGFDCFAPRVLFVKVEDHLPLQQLQHGLKKALISQLSFLEPQRDSKFHPHMTIATRDLSASDFKAAWEAFQSRKFQASFCADSLFLLKHNGKTWDLLMEFPFQDLPGS